MSIDNLNVEAEKAQLEQQLEESWKMLNHIKELFEIRSNVGIIPKMNEVYVALSEVHTGNGWGNGIGLDRLRETLGLDSNLPVSRVLTHGNMRVNR